MSNNKSKDNKLKCELAQPLLSQAPPLIPLGILPMHESGGQLQHKIRCVTSPKNAKQRPVQLEEESKIKKFLSFFKFKWIFPLAPYS